MSQTQDLEQCDLFAIKLIGAIGDVLSNEDNEFYIDPEEMEKHATDFCHALMNIMPSHIVAELSGDSKNLLESNHLANRLCFQYSKKA
jgi:hypothetical protein